jgi:predicted histone-like DNA-binding protein
MKGKSEGRYYAKAVTMGELHTLDLAQIISASNSVTVSDVQGVLAALMQVMEQYLGDGQNIILDGFGRFKLSLESESVSNPDDFKVAEHVKAIHCNFIPEGKLPKVGSKQVKTFCSGVKVVAAPINDVREE